MPHVPAPSDIPGIRGLFAFRPETAEPLKALAETLLRGPSPLSTADRELIAAHVSRTNECAFCTRSHAAIARAARGSDAAHVVDAVLDDPATAPISDKLRGLLAIAARVAQGGSHVTEAALTRARAHGATDVEIHDTVLIAAAFCMFNRYVDGLAATTPNDPDAYAAGAQAVVTRGYQR